MLLNGWVRHCHHGWKTSIVFWDRQKVVGDFDQRLFWHGVGVVWTFAVVDGQWSGFVGQLILKRTPLSSAGLVISDKLFCVDHMCSHLSWTRLTVVLEDLLQVKYKCFHVGTHQIVKRG